jgi:ATP-dependent RNA helicase DeaD
MLHAIERATRQKIEPLELPSTETINNKRIADFKQRISDTLAAGDLAFMQSVVEQYQQEHDVPAVDIAAALASMTIGDRPLLLDPQAEKAARQAERTEREHSKRGNRHERSEGTSARGRKDRQSSERKSRGPSKPSSAEMELFRLEVGLADGVEPRNIVGALANEAGLDAEHIGAITIDTAHSLVELPMGMPKDVFKDLRKVWVCGKQLNLSRMAPGKHQAHSRKKEDHSGNGEKVATKSRKKSSQSKKTPKPARRPDKKRVSAEGPRKPKRRAGSKRPARSGGKTEAGQ